MGHIAPEYLSTGKSSERTDVFGYGIMLLELVTGQRAIDFSRLEEEDDVLLLDHVRSLSKIIASLFDSLVLWFSVCSLYKKFKKKNKGNLRYDTPYLAISKPKLMAVEGLSAPVSLRYL